MYKKSLIFGILLQVLVTSINAQTNIYVSPQGNDHNKGSLSAPLRSIEQALHIANQHGGQVTIALRGGTYFLDTTLLIRSTTLNTTSLTICNYKEESVIISGGKKLDLAWEAYKNGIMVAKVAQNQHFDQLFVNNEKQVLARYPNYDPSARILKGTAADAVSIKRVSRWKHPEGGYLHGLQAYEWGSLSYKITGKKPDGSLQLEGGWQNNRPSSLHKQFRYVEGIFEQLDTANEWYLDSKNGLLYYYPPKDLNLATAKVIVSELKNSIELIGDANNPIKNIHIKGISFCHNAPTFMDTREPILRSDWRIYRGGVILLNGTENCSIENCDFYNLGGNAVMVSNYNQRALIQGCHFYNIGANAICFIGSEKAVRSPINNYAGFIAYKDLDKVPGPLTNDYPQNCIADNNLIHDIGLIEKQVAGVDINISSQIRVSHNTIYNVPRAGINIGDGCFGGQLIEYNMVFNTVLETGDHGAFNSWGRDRFWNADRNYMDSLVAIHPELIRMDAQMPNILRNNLFSCKHGWDIDLDDGSSNYEIYNNLCLNGGIKFREGFYRKGFNNIIINNSFHPHVWFKNSHDDFEHNIVMDAYKPIRVNGWGDTVDYNLFLTKNDLLHAQAAGTDTHSTFGNPLFINPKIGNYQVNKTSPAIKVGFKNFPMNEFGVQNSRLKKMAASPIYTLPNLIATKAKSDQITEFLGAKMREVNGLEDRSAYGLADEHGIIILSLEKNSIFEKAGIQSKDVIRECNGVQIKRMDQLIQIINNLRNTNRPIKLEVIRDQQLRQFNL